MFSRRVQLQRACLKPNWSRCVSSASPQQLNFQTANVDGLNVASRDDGSPVAALSVIVRAGSRFEPGPGMAHLLERFAFKSTARRSTFRISRESELLGGRLSSSIGRENLILSAEFLREDLPYYVELMGEVVGATLYKDYEFVEEVVPAAQLDYQNYQNSKAAVGDGALHTAAFRRGLGNSLLATPETVADLSMLKSYASQAFVKNNLALVGSGVEKEEFESLVSTYFGNLQTGSAAKSAPSKYYGGEVRISASGNVSRFVLGLDSSHASPAEQSVLHHLLGGQSSIKWSSGSSPLSNVAGQFPMNTSVVARGLSYTDAGLLSVTVTSPKQTIADAAVATWKAIKDTSSKVSSEDVKRAAAQAKFSLLAASEGKLANLEAIGTSMLTTGKGLDTAAAAQALDKVTMTNVKHALDKMMKSNPTVIAIGNTHQLPYFDEL